MTEGRAATDERGRRIPLPWLLVPLFASMAIGMIADIAGPGLINERPLLQIVLNARNRYLLLAAAQVDALSFFLVGFFRLTLTDPIGYVLGRQYGEGGRRWIKEKLGDDGGVMANVEHHFARLAPLVMLLAPNLYMCVLAGATGMRPRVFVPLNVLGTIGRLLLFWFAADTFQEQLLDVLDVIQRYQWPLIAVSFVLVSLQARRFNRRMSGESLEEIEEEIEGGAPPA